MLIPVLRTSMTNLSMLTATLRSQLFHGGPSRLGKDAPVSVGFKKPDNKMCPVACSAGAKNEIVAARNQTKLTE